MPNIHGSWLRKPTVWRAISLATWSDPDNATIYGTLDIELTNLQAYLKEQSEKTGVKCTITHAVSRAVALCLREQPECNVLIRGRHIWLRDDVDIFHQVAMPIDEAGGKADLSGAVIRRADTKKIHEIAEELREKAQRVRAKEDGEMAKTRSMFLRMPPFLLTGVMKLTGWLSYGLNLNLPTVPRDPFGSAMVSAVGMFGIKMAYAPLVTFSRCPIVILVGQIEDRPMVRDGEVVIRPMCTLTASMDHRILDGFQAGLLAKGVRKYLENPELMDQDVAQNN